MKEEIITRDEFSKIFCSLDYDPKLVNWYKLYHVGRALNVHGFKTHDEIKELKEVL